VARPVVCKRERMLLALYEHNFLTSASLIVKAYGEKGS